MCACTKPSRVLTEKLLEAFKSLGFSVGGKAEICGSHNNILANKSGLTPLSETVWFDVRSAKQVVTKFLFLLLIYRLSSAVGFGRQNARMFISQNTTVPLEEAMFSTQTNGATISTLPCVCPERCATIFLATVRRLPLVCPTFGVSS